MYQITIRTEAETRIFDEPEILAGESQVYEDRLILAGTPYWFEMIEGDLECAFFYDGKEARL